MIGLLGGTFNPIHQGHLSIAQDVLQCLKLERVEFMPCHTPVHRQSPLVSVEHRVSMLKLALKGHDQFHINSCEVDRGGSSYMIDTLRFLQQDEEPSRVLIVGTDAFNNLHQWKQADRLFDYCHIVVCQRADQVCTQNQFDQYRVSKVSELIKKPIGGLYFLNVSPVPCSSTQLREKLSKQQSVSQYLAQPVVEFIQSNHLYASFEN